jgi:hypothetical protein
MRTPTIRLSSVLAAAGALSINSSTATAAWLVEPAPAAADGVLCSRHIVLESGEKLAMIVDQSIDKECTREDPGHSEAATIIRGDVKSRLIGPTPPKGVAQRLAPNTARYFRALTSTTGERAKTLYGLMFPAREIAELTRRDDGRWKKAVLPGAAPGALEPFMALGDARNDGSENLYVLGDRLYEYRHTRESWTRTEVTTVEIQSGDYGSATAIISVSGFANGLVIADPRNDGIKRIYAAVDNKIVEMTRVEDSWRREEIAPGKGFLSGLAALGRDEAPVQLVFGVRNSPGRFSLKWTEGDRVVVADFGHGHGDFASSFSDLLRVKLVQIGNCRVLEREQMKSILAEHRFQETGVFSAEYAVSLGKLLNAKQVVVGRLENLPKSRLVNVNAVSVGTGLIERSTFQEWRSSGEMEQALGVLALSICPGMPVK